MVERVKLKKKKVVQRDPRAIIVWTERPAKIILRGEQQTEIKWLDTGTHQAIPNDQFR